MKKVTKLGGCIVYFNDRDFDHRIGLPANIWVNGDSYHMFDGKSHKINGKAYMDRYYDLYGKVIEINSSKLVI